VLIIRRSKLYYAASGIVTHCRWPSGAQVERRLFAQPVQASACNTDTTQTQPHQISNTQRTENKTTDVVIQQHSRKLLMMDILIPETCWVRKKWNKIASDIKLVFYSSTITMMYGPINIRIIGYYVEIVHDRHSLPPCMLTILDHFLFHRTQ